MAISGRVTQQSSRRTFLHSTVLGGIALGTSKPALAIDTDDEREGDNRVTKSGSEQFHALLSTADGERGPTGPLKTAFSTATDSNGTRIAVDEAGGVLVYDPPVEPDEPGSLERYRIGDDEFSKDWEIGQVDLIHDVFDDRVLLERDTAPKRQYTLVDVESGESLSVTRARGKFPPGTIEQRHGDTIYVFDRVEQTFAAYDTIDGNRRWETETDHMLGETVVIDDVVLATIDEDGIAAYDVETGQRQWRYAPGDGRPRGPVTDGESAYFLQTDATLVAVAPDGTREWTLEVPGDYGLRYNQLVSDENRLLLTTDRPEETPPDTTLLSAVDADTGELLWTQHERTDVRDIESFASRGETIVATVTGATGDDSAMVIDATDGTIRRTIREPDLLTETTAYRIDNRQMAPYRPKIVGIDLASGAETTRCYIDESTADLAVADGSLFALVGASNASPAAIYKITEADRTFLDVPASHWAFDPIESLAAESIITGFGDGTFRPGQLVTRAQMAAMLVQAFDLQGTPDPEIEFDDIDGHWGQEQILLAADAGLISGYPDGSFRPDERIARQEVLAICATTLDIETVDVESLLAPFEDTPSDWAREAVAKTVKADVLEHDRPAAELSKLLPEVDASRAMVANFLWNLLNAEELEDIDTTSRA
jgi:hypothetical protein